MKIDKERFNDLWNDVFSRRQFEPLNSGEAYYILGCLDTMRAIKDMEEKEDEII